MKKNELKIGQQVMLQEGVLTESLICKDVKNLGKGDKLLVIPKGFKVLTGELKGKIILEEHGAKKYDRESVAKMIINKIKNEDMDLEEVLSDDYVADCIRDSIEDLLFDILP